jgi:anti-sigma-K factor RskA
MTQAEPDDQELLAAEYVLGTLDTEERARARALVVMDPGFAAAVRAWERRLGELNVLVAAVEPPPNVWDRIRASTAGPAAGAELETPAVELPPERTQVEELRTPAVEPPTSEQPRLEDRGPEIVRLQRRVRRWRKFSLWLFLLAAAAAGFGALRELHPEYLPAELRPKMRTAEVTKTVEIPSPKPAQFVAVLQKEGVQPAFLLSFDLERRTLMVRNVSAPLQAGKSYQLWLISSRFSSPRSLGVIGTEEYTRPQLAAYDPVILNSATYSVSLEPEGGSPTGMPTGPMLYSGKLIQATPTGFRDQTP